MTSGICNLNFGIWNLEFKSWKKDKQQLKTHPMKTIFYIAATLAILATIKVISGRNAVHALLYLIASFLCIAVVLFVMGAPFAAALEVIIYAGAIMVLFVFIVMMLNVKVDGPKKDSELMKTKTWMGPSIIVIVLLFEMIYLFLSNAPSEVLVSNIPPEEVGKLMFSKYILMANLVSFLLMAGIVGAYHLGRKDKKVHHRYLQDKNQEK